MQTARDDGQEQEQAGASRLDLNRASARAGSSIFSRCDWMIRWSA